MKLYIWKNEEEFYMLGTVSEQLSENSSVYLIIEDDETGNYVGDINPSLLIGVKVEDVSILYNKRRVIVDMDAVPAPLRDSNSNNNSFAPVIFSNIDLNNDVYSKDVDIELRSSEYTGGSKIFHAPKEWPMRFEFGRNFGNNDNYGYTAFVNPDGNWYLSTNYYEHDV